MFRSLYGNRISGVLGFVLAIKQIVRNSTVITLIRWQLYLLVFDSRLVSTLVFSVISILSSIISVIEVGLIDARNCVRMELHNWFDQGSTNVLDKIYLRFNYGSELKGFVKQDIKSEICKLTFFVYR